MITMTALRDDATLGARDAQARIATRPTIAVFIASIGLALVAGMLERRSAGSGAVDRALGAVFNLVVPLSSFAIFALATGRRRLDQTVWSVARFGADRRGVALGAIASAWVAAAAVGALAAVAAVVTAHGSTSAPLAADAITSGWIAGLTAIAYVSWFAVGATFFKFGGGRAVILVLDFILGDAGLLGDLMPRGLAKNLLGLAVSELPQRGASGMLVGTAIVGALIAAYRCGR